MSRERTQVKPGNALRLVAIFAQPPPPTASSSSPPSQTLILPNGESVTIYGTLYDPPGPLQVLVHGADGNVTNVGTPTRSVTGIWYLDTVIALTAWPGPEWCQRWYETGAAVDSNLLAESFFEVVPLNF